MYHATNYFFFQINVYVPFIVFSRWFHVELFLSGNASCTVAEALVSSSPSTPPISSFKVVERHAQLIEAANEMNFQLMMEIQKKIETIQFSWNNIKAITQTVINKDTIISKHHYFNMITTEGIDHAEKCYLNVRSENAPTWIWGDNWVTNVKACCRAGEWYDIQFPVTPAHHMQSVGSFHGQLLR